MTQINKICNNKNPWNIIKKLMQLNTSNKKDITMFFSKKKRNSMLEKNMRNKDVLFKRKAMILFRNKRFKKKDNQLNSIKDTKNTMKKEVFKPENKRMYPPNLKILMNKKSLRVFSLYKSTHLWQGRNFCNYQPRMKYQLKI